MTGEPVSGLKNSHGVGYQPMERRVLNGDETVVFVMFFREIRFGFLPRVSNPLLYFGFAIVPVREIVSDFVAVVIAVISPLARSVLIIEAAVCVQSVRRSRIKIVSRAARHHRIGYTGPATVSL